MTSVVVQLLASVVTLLGLYYGSTGFAGALWIALSCPLWITVTIRAKQWALFPYNIAMSVVAMINLGAVL